MLPTFEIYTGNTYNAVKHTLSLNNETFLQAEYCRTRFSWMAYGLSNGHFFSTTQTNNLHLYVILRQTWIIAAERCYTSFDAAPLFCTVSTSY